MASVFHILWLLSLPHLASLLKSCAFARSTSALGDWPCCFILHRSVPQLPQLEHSLCRMLEQGEGGIFHKVVNVPDLVLHLF